MKLILSHPTANNFARALAYNFLRAGILYEFHTSIATFPGSILDSFGGVSLLSEIRRRRFEIELKPFVRTFPWFELGRQIALKAGFSKLVRNENGVISLDNVYKSLDRRIASELKAANARGVSCVYAYEDGALATFMEAKVLGLKCAYDLPIAYWETKSRIMEEEAERIPQWSLTLGGSITDSSIKLERKAKEMELADLVVVPSQFVRDSLPDWTKGKQVVIAPFGSPLIKGNKVKDYTESSISRPLRVLFAGSMGQRKGLADLFTAVRSLKRNDIELVVMGSPQAPMEFYRKEFNNFTFEPGRSHEKVLELMRSCDVFCLPSLVEGRALVMQEAMSQGLPLIITPNTGGSDLIIEGLTGFLVPIRSPLLITEKLTWFLENRSAISQMGRNAQKLAKQYTWENYGSTIIEAVKSLEI